MCQGLFSIPRRSEPTRPPTPSLPRPTQTRPKSYTLGRAARRRPKSVLQQPTTTPSSYQPLRLRAPGRLHCHNEHTTRANAVAEPHAGHVLRPQRSPRRAPPSWQILPLQLRSKPTPEQPAHAHWVAAVLSRRAFFHEVRHGSTADYENRLVALAVGLGCQTAPATIPA